MKESQNAKYIEVELDKTRKLLFDINAMANFEKATGKNFFDYSQNVSKTSATELRALLWAGLIHEDAKLTIEQVGAMIYPGNMLSIQESLIKAQLANSGKSESSSEEKKDPLAGSRQE